MPRHYKGNVQYQNDENFKPISLNNIFSYTEIGKDDRFTYLVKNELNGGYIFLNEDLERKYQHALPVMTISLRDSGIGNLKQAHALRMRRGYARENLTTSWYVYFINQFGGIVSDNEHLEGGKLLWQAFIKIGTSDKNLSISLHDIDSGLSTPVTTDTAESEIWSTDDDTKKNLVLILALRAKL